MKNNIVWFGLRRNCALRLPHLRVLLLVASITTAIGPCAHAQGYSVLYSFQCGPTDGAFPSSTLVLNAAGNLYGVSGSGGAYGFGTVFQLSPGGVEILLHSFAGFPTDGSDPVYTELVSDLAGNLYGTTGSGGSFGNGTVYRVSSVGTETVLYSFTGENGDGTEPFGGVLLDRAGNFYGTTAYGGLWGYGTVFKLDPSKQESILYNGGIHLTGLTQQVVVC